MKKACHPSSCTDERGPVLDRLLEPDGDVVTVLLTDRHAYVGLHRRLITAKGHASMALELINPAGLMTPESYAQVVAATGSRLVFVAGQVAQDADGRLVAPGDLAAQAREAFA